MHIAYFWLIVNRSETCMYLYHLEFAIQESMMCVFLEKTDLIRVWGHPLVIICLHLGAIPLTESFCDPTINMNYMAGSVYNWE